MATNTSTPESSTVRVLTGELKLALQGDILTVSLNLQAADPPLLTPDNVSEVTNIARSEPERAVRLVTLIQNKVESDPRCYHALIGVLQKNRDYYGDILKKLEERFRLEKAKNVHVGGGQPQQNTATPAGGDHSEANSSNSETRSKQIILTSKDLGVLLRLLLPVAAHWQLIAPHLNPQLPEGTVAQIQMDNSGKPDACKHCLREMIGKWLKRIRPCQPSWQNLRAAIDGAVIDGSDGMIDKIDQHIRNAAGI